MFGRTDMPGRGRARRWSLRLIAAVAIVFLGFNALHASGAQPLTPRQALVRVMNAPELRTDWFAPSFLARVRLSQIATVVSVLDAELGDLTDVHAERAGWYTMAFRRGVDRVRIALDGRGRITTLQFQPPQQNAA